MIIGICGLIGSGKDTIADYLIKRHNFQKLSFADKLKDSVATMFDWDRSLLDGKTDQSRQWREEIDEYWSNETGEEITPRLVLQLFGTECMRNGFYDGIWVSLTKKKILDNPMQNFVIPDVRFPNEVTAIKNQGGQIVWVQRGRLPEWYNSAVEANNGSNLHINEMKINKIHASEWAWVGTEFDHVIENDTSIDDLYTTVKKLIVSS